MAKKMTRAETDKMLVGRYGNAYVSPPVEVKKRGRPKKKTSEALTLADVKGEDAG